MFATSPIDGASKLHVEYKRHVHMQHEVSLPYDGSYVSAQQVDLPIAVAPVHKAIGYSALEDTFVTVTVPVQVVNAVLLNALVPKAQ